ncbi:histone acetyltransferase type B catalytic subunit [Argentina anserina]|uniref:histone acetyltransferase type B catalytic subunit n=1 Tax=Argentina anserina TaxID=57926 RepID=UPI0021762B0B|nr:histone acetyltransferase type B catalytic subunit [Potentilla anserina]
MGQKKGPAADDSLESKKRRRVDFSGVVDAGVEAKDCIKIYLVSSKDEVGALNSVCLDPVDLNTLFEDDGKESGKIYGYKGLEITIWISSISFDAYADIAFESTADGGKGITDLKSTLQNVFGETLVASQEEFLQTFSTQRNFIRSIISNGEVMQRKASSASDVEVVRMVVGKTAAGPLYSRLLPLVFLLVDGGSPIDVLDPGWELYLLVEKKTDQHGDIYNTLLGFTALYRFYHYPDSSRLRLSQILVLPPYQHKGYGRYILEVLNHVVVSEDVYDFTVEEPLDYFQHIRTCVDVPRLQKLDSVRSAVNLAVSNLTRGKLSKKTSIPRLMPATGVIADVRKRLKINKKQFLRCWEVLVYLGLNPVDKYMEDFVSIVSNHMKEDIIGKESGTGGKQVIEVPSEYIPEMSFVMFKSNTGKTTTTVQVDENQPKPEEQLQELVDERVTEIKSIAEKVSQHRISIEVSS